MTTQRSQNGYPVDKDKLYVWIIPVKRTAINRYDGAHDPIRIRMRNGSAGFLLAHFVLWWLERFECVVIPGLWGFADRDIRGSDETSNHASGTAVDINAPLHPLGKRTLSTAQRVRLQRRLLVYRGVIRSGAFYKFRLDEMHAEIDKGLPYAEKVARRLMDSPRGKRILAANPSQRAVILS